MKIIYNFFHHLYHRRYHGIYRHAKKLFILDICLLAAAIITLATGLFFFFWNPSIKGQIDLEVSFGGNRIKSGETVTVIVNYSNNSKYTLKNTLLSLHLPKGFLVNRSKTPDYFFSREATIDLKTIKPGAKGQVEISGWMYAPVKTEEKIIAFLSYTPAELNFQDQKTATFILNLPESILETKIETSDTAFPSSKLPLLYKITNRSKEKINGLNLQTEFSGTVLWSSKETEKINLAAGETKTFSAEITLPAQDGDLVLKVTPTITVNNHQIKIQTDSKNIKSVAPNLTTRLELLNNITYAEPGQTIPLKIYWSNTSNAEVKNLRLKIVATPGIIDTLSTVKENNIKNEGLDLIVDSSRRTSLSGNSFKADSYLINLRLSPHFSLAEDTVNLEIYPIIEADLPVISEQRLSLKGEPLKIKLATSVQLNAQARYYTADGDQLGRGPLPPKVGETTKYWIYITVNNSINPLRDTKFNIILAPDAQFTTKQSVSIGPALNYNPDTNILNWNFYRLPANSQTGVYFEVAVTPGPQQIGRKIKLVENIQFSATDSATGKILNLQTGSIYNNLAADDLGNAKVAEVEN